ncbi:hypothetical protein PFICI_14294 [Pestalotiopsis fici W106-1]|uniref:Aminotransferase class I/classII large domain-containing protein n=1 Tax=Pestalotiopsis fici (strain W106-1 / CGMCC3.15140) TaxID=1229662 RepID=W3WKL9_PESFW|nr:uncharacterized protein PFICI_14294 [Pestalotiopsis fici W106-1]ETS74428.1 hypothetical protein PFICI_14294 [Pestalotiopsis fici W106-1]
MVIKYGVPEKHINLQGGWPTPRLHPSAELGEAAARVFSNPNIQEKLRYGAGQGEINLRSHIASWLTDEYQPEAGAVNPDRILVSNGASNGLATILQKFADPGQGEEGYTQTVWMVEPTYHLAAAIFRDAGFNGVGPGGRRRIRGVPEGVRGVDLEYLRTAIQASEKDHEGHYRHAQKDPNNGYPKIYRHILYMVPTFSNPSGRTMAYEDRVALVQLAREFDMLLVTDDVYDVLRWCPEDGCACVRAEDGNNNNNNNNNTRRQRHLISPPRLVDIDRILPGSPSPFGNTVSNGSFSKIVAPGTRVGWMEATPDFVATLTRVGATSSGGNQAHMSSLIIGELFAQGDLQRHLKHVLIPTYRKRYYTMVAAIRHYLYPFGVRIATEESSDAADAAEQPAGGFFLYILFPREDIAPAVDDICSLALEHFNLKIAPGRIFSVADDPVERPDRSRDFVSGARLCWAWHEEDELIEGIERLAETLKMANSKSS